MRKSNIELCRLASILLVMLVHTVGSKFEGEVSLGVDILKAFSIIGANVFILITGYFSVTPKKTSLFNLAFICLFWMIVKLCMSVFTGEPITYNQAFFLTSSNWFIASYIALLFTTPILNIFCNSVNKKVLWEVVMALLIIEIWFDLLPPHPKVSLGSQNGYSVFSFMILYLLARAIRLHGLPEWFKKISPIVYIGCSLLLGGIVYAIQLCGYNNIPSMAFAYSNPIVILSSVAFLLSFEKYSFKSKFINHMSKSTLAVLLGHTSIVLLYTTQFRFIYDNYSGMQVIGYWALSIVIVFCASIVIDQIRLFLYKPIEKYVKYKVKINVIFEDNKKSSK